MENTEKLIESVTVNEEQGIWNLSTTSNSLIPISRTIISSTKNYQTVYDPSFLPSNPGADSSTDVDKVYEEKRKEFYNLYTSPVAVLIEGLRLISFRPLDNVHQYELRAVNPDTKVPYEEDADDKQMRDSRKLNEKERDTYRLVPTHLPSLARNRTVFPEYLGSIKDPENEGKTKVKTVSFSNSKAKNEPVNTDILFFMAGTPGELFYINFSKEHPDHGGVNKRIKDILFHYRLMLFLKEKLGFDAEVASEICFDIIRKNAIKEGSKRKVALCLEQEEIKNIIENAFRNRPVVYQKNKNEQTNQTAVNFNDELDGFVKSIKENSTMSIGNARFNSIGLDNMDDDALRAELTKVLKNRAIVYGWGTERKLEHIQSPKKYLFKNILYPFIDISITSTIVNLDLKGMLSEHTLSLPSINTSIDVNTLILLSLAALYSAYYFKNFYTEQETRRFKDNAPQIMGHEEDEKLAEIEKESNVFAAQGGMLALFSAFLSSNKNYSGLHYEGALVAAAFLGFSLAIATCVAQKSSNIEADKVKLPWKEFVSGIIVGAISYLITASFAQIPESSDYGWFNNPANSGRVLSFGFGLLGFGAVRYFGNTVSGDAEKNHKNPLQQI